MTISQAQDLTNKEFVDAAIAALQTVVQAYADSAATTAAGAVGDTSATSSSVAKRNSDANLLADNFIATRTSTATAAGTTTLTIADSQVQVFTGSTTQTVKLPTTGVVAGQTYVIVNNSSGLVTVQSSGANSIIGMFGSRCAIFIARVDAPTADTDWLLLPSATPAASGNAIAMRNSDANLLADCFIATVTSTATAAGTTTLTIGSTQTQVFTGSTTQTCVLPTTSVVAGQQYTIINNSSGTVTVNSSGGNLVATLLAGESKIIYALAATPTTAAHWRAV